ncbi:RbsD/FucU family protein [Lactobacillus crispatus]|uniref:RbsD/FucU family protein n=1 Tax=Lactobacillus crispatus TaxID=47770 RepID=UPI000B5DB4FC|nr:RbsD/FucU domain-containing protein [Lactobacillus crispatus]OXC32938.1 hypothetical protein AYP87_07720 [Lactobacillus crispatus]OXC33597.1 hypothetical protein AYP89_09295 [Lactobacillus crispatus]
MLKGISPAISPELLKILAEMGHGDTIVIGDCNYPACSTGKRVVRCDGVSATELLEGIMELFPLDVNEPGAPVVLMKSTDNPDYKPKIWNDFKDIISKHETQATYDYCDRFEFYDKAREAYACVQSSEQKYFGCIILRKGPWFSKAE